MYGIVDIGSNTMRLVIYKVNGTSAYKCGFTVYDGGVE